MANPLFEFVRTELGIDVSAAERELEAVLSRLVAAGNQPDFLIPFAIDKTAAVNAYHKWLQGLSFVPGNLKTRADLGAIQQVYIPFWAIHSMTCTNYSGERGEEITASEEHTVDGEVKTRQVSRIEWSPAWGEVRQLFDNVYLCAATDVQEAHLGVLEPREIKNHQSCTPEATGATTVKVLKLDAREGFTKAREQMEKKLRSQVETDIGGRQQRVNRMDTRHVGVSLKLLLLPAYEGTYQYGGKSYRIVINGATGDVSGDYPVSAGRVIVMILIVLGVIAALGAALWYFVIKPNTRHKSEVPVERPALVRLHRADPPGRPVEAPP